MDRLRGLSKREKVLIYILMIVVIVAVGIVFLIKPAVSKADKITSDYQKARITAVQMKTAIANKDDTQLETKEYEKKIKNAKRQYKKNMKTEKVDELLTGMIKSSGLTPVEMTINGQDSSTSESGGASSSSGAASTGDTVKDSTISDGGTDQNAAAKYTHVKVDTAAASATGSVSECITLIENARKTIGVRVAAFRITGDTATSDSSEISGYTAGAADTSVTTAADTAKTKTTTEYTLEISFEVYEVKDL